MAMTLTNSVNLGEGLGENKVFCKDRMPTKEGYYKTSVGVVYCEFVPPKMGLKYGHYWSFGYNPEWWIEA